jgi:hypothetical protein
MSTRRRRNFHLVADYGSAGGWDHDGAPLDPARLPLSPKLRTRLAQWGGRSLACCERRGLALGAIRPFDVAA